jgi:hypothetical protein
MSDSERFDDPSLEEVERLLLKAGRAGAPAGAKHRALAAVSGAVAASTIASGQAAAASVIVKSALVSSKWLAVLSLTGAVAVSGAIAVRQSHPVPAIASSPARGDFALHAPPRRASVPRQQIPPAPAPTLVATPAASSVAAPMGPASPAVAAAATLAHANASAAPSFSVELSALDQARTAIADGEPARALSILDEYTANFPRGAMGPEAAVLRVEALLRAGDRAAAERVAHSFLQNTPGSPYGPRIKSLLGSNP